MKTTLLKLFMLSLVITIGACSKEGDVGPAGAQGPAGEQGPEGPEGKPGTANVIYSPWMDITWNGINEPAYKTMRIDEDKITSEFLENGGTVLYYIRQKTTDFEVVLALPHFLGSIHMYGVTQISSGQSRVGLAAQTQDGSDIPADFFSGLQFRYVLIPGGTVTGRMRTDYETIKALYNIRD
jgi:hypothetical protein